MKILFTITNLKIGGAQIVALRLAKKLHELGHQVDIYDHFPDDRNSSIINIHFPGANICSVAESKWKRKIIWKLNALLQIGFPNYSFFDALNKLTFKSLANSRYDIIHSHMLESDWIVASIGLNQKRNSLIMTTHGCYEENIKLFGIEKLKLKYKKIFESFGKVAYLSDKNINFLKNLELSDFPHTLKIYNGITTNNQLVDSISIKKDSIFRIGMVARGVRTKGWEELINTCIKIKQESDIKLELNLIGDSHYLSKLSENYSMYSFINFHGHIEEPLSKIMTFDLGVLPTYYKAESLPTSIMEFLALGIPVVATDIGEIGSMIDDQKNGLSAGCVIPLINGKPNLGEFEKAILQMATNRSLYLKKKKDTQKLAQKFDIEKCADKYLSYYKK